MTNCKELTTAYVHEKGGDFLIDQLQTSMRMKGGGSIRLSLPLKSYCDISQCFFPIFESTTTIMIY